MNQTLRQGLPSYESPIFDRIPMSRLTTTRQSDKYDGLFNASEHPEFGAALSQIYLDIIELCTDIKKKIREQKTSRMKRVFQPLSASVNLQLEDYVVKFKDHQKTVETEAHLCHSMLYLRTKSIPLIWLCE